MQLSAGFTFELGFDVGKHEIFAKAWLKFGSINSALRGIYGVGFANKIPYLFSLLGGFICSSAKAERRWCHRFRRSERSFKMLFTSSYLYSFFFKYYFVKVVVCTCVCLSAKSLYQLWRWFFWLPALLSLFYQGFGKINRKTSQGKTVIGCSISGIRSLFHLRSDWLVKITLKILFCDWLTGLKTKGELGKPVSDRTISRHVTSRYLQINQMPRKVNSDT